MADDPTTSGLRRQLEAALAEREELRAYKRTVELGQVLGDFGLEPDRATGKVAVDAYDGPPDADAFREWMTDQGFEPVGDERGRPVDERAEAYVRLLAAREQG